MPKAVLDSTVLVSAFFSRTGVSRHLLQFVNQEDVGFYVSDQILVETFLTSQTGRLYLLLAAATGRL